MAEDSLRLEVLTPARRVLAIETSSVVIPGELGEIGVLPGHVPLITTLESGVLRYHAAGTRRDPARAGTTIAVHYGYAQVEAGRVTVLSEMAEPGDEIDLERARRAEEKARETLAEMQRNQDADYQRYHKFTAKVQRALVRQQAGR